MEATFNYHEVPDGFLHCGNETCLRSGDCLRHLAFKYISEDKPYILLLNPGYISKQEECPYFRSNAPVRLALGITKLFNNLPYSKAKIIKKTIHDHFGHSAYYRIYNKKYFIKAAAQEFIRETFKKYRIEDELVYDNYLYCYEWTDDTEKQLVSNFDTAISGYEMNSFAV